MRYHLSGKYANGDQYSDVFPSLKELRETHDECTQSCGEFVNDSFTAFSEDENTGEQTPIEIRDLFQYPELLPKKIQKILEKIGDDLTYKSCENLIKKLKPMGYTFDYYLDATPYNLRKI